MIYDFVNAIMEFGFMQRGLIVAILIGVICGVLGTFVVLRGLSLMGDAISHSVLPGVAISHMLGISHVIGASVFGVIASFVIGFISKKSLIKKDTSIGIVLTTFFSLGIVIISRTRTMADLHHILFGNLLSVRPDDVVLVLIIGAILLIFIFLFYKELVVTSFDETLAKVYGLKTELINYTFLFILTLVIVSSLQAVGAVLVVAMIITPAATSYLLTHKLTVMMVISALIGAFSSVVGLFFSFSYNLSSGATIVLTMSVLFILALLFAPEKGILLQNLKSRKGIDS